MWVARVWFLVALLAASVGFAGALTLITVGDDDVAAGVAARVVLEAELLNAQVSAQMADQRRATQLLAADPRLHSTLEQLVPDMPVDVQRALLVKTLKLIGADHPRVVIGLFDATGLRAASADDIGPSMNTTRPVERAREGRIGVGLVEGEPSRWVVAAPLVGVKDPFVLATAAIPPGPAIARIHEAAQLTSSILVQRGETPVAGSVRDADQAAVAAAPAVGANGHANAATATVLEAPHFVHRFAVPSAPGYTFVLVWPATEASTLEQAGGLGGLGGRALADTQVLGICAGVAFLLWLVGMLLMSRGARGAVLRLSRDLRLLGADRHSLLDPGTYSSWLRPIIDSANEAAEDSRRQTARTIALDMPGEESIDAPEAAVEASGSSDSIDAIESLNGIQSVEASAERSSERSVERVSHRSSEIPAEISSETSAEGSAEDSAETSSETSGEASGDPTQRAVRTRPKPPEVKRAPLPPSQPIPPEISSSLFDMSLPSLEADDDEPEEEEPTDAGIELPRSSDRPPQVQGSLLDRLRARSALDPAPQPPRAQFSSGDSTVVKAVPIELLTRSREEDEDRTTVGPPPERPADRDDLERYFRQVYDEFLSAKGRCGERVDNVDYGRFRAKLVRTRKALMDRFECRDVKFRVYTKEGKAALKASPVVDD